MQICASLNHRKKMKVEPNRLVPLTKAYKNLALLFVVIPQFCLNYFAAWCSGRPLDLHFSREANERDAPVV